MAKWNLNFFYNVILPSDSVKEVQAAEGVVAWKHISWFVCCGNKEINELTSDTNQICAVT